MLEFIFENYGRIAVATLAIALIWTITREGEDYTEWRKDNFDD